MKITKVELSLGGDKEQTAARDDLKKRVEIQGIKKQAYGFRNKENFKTAIYFHCGGLDLYPACVGASATH